jgi:hypothetical protein
MTGQRTCQAKHACPVASLFYVIVTDLPVEKFSMQLEDKSRNFNLLRCFRFSTFLILLPANVRNLKRMDEYIATSVDEIQTMANARKLSWGEGRSRHIDMFFNKKLLMYTIGGVLKLERDTRPSSSQDSHLFRHHQILAS